MNSNTDKQVFLSKISYYKQYFTFMVINHIIEKDMKVEAVHSLLLNKFKVNEILATMLIGKYIYSKKYKNENYVRKIDKFVDRFSLADLSEEVKNRVIPRSAIVQRIGGYVDETLTLLNFFENEVSEMVFDPISEKNKKIFEEIFAH
jgi:hypothetical protein